MVTISGEDNCTPFKFSARKSCGGGELTFWCGMVTISRGWPSHLPEFFQARFMLKLPLIFISWKGSHVKKVVGLLSSSTHWGGKGPLPSHPQSKNKKQNKIKLSSPFFWTALLGKTPGTATQAGYDWLFASILPKQYYMWRHTPKLAEHSHRLSTVPQPKNTSDLHLLKSTSPTQTEGSKSYLLYFEVNISIELSNQGTRMITWSHTKQVHHRSWVKHENTAGPSSTHETYVYRWPPLSTQVAWGSPPRVLQQSN